MYVFSRNLSVEYIYKEYIFIVTDNQLNKNLSDGYIYFLEFFGVG